MARIFRLLGSIAATVKEEQHSGHWMTTLAEKGPMPRDDGRGVRCEEDDTAYRGGSLAGLRREEEKGSSTRRHMVGPLGGFFCFPSRWIPFFSFRRHHALALSYLVLHSTAGGLVGCLFVGNFSATFFWAFTT